MPQQSVTISIARPIDKVFLFFSKPMNLQKLAPPDFHLELVEGPAIMQLGSRITWKGKRWGVAQKMVQEVTRFESPALLVEEQKQGPFGRWVVERHFTP